MAAPEDRRGFLRGAALGAIGIAAGVAVDGAPLATTLAGADPAIAATARRNALAEVERTMALTRVTTPAAGIISVKDLGAKGDGKTDDSAAFAAAVSQAAKSSRALPFSLSPDPVGSVLIDVPPGTYVIKKPKALLGNEKAPIKINGLRWRGAGNAITTIVFKPSSGGVMLQNDLWQNLQFEGISFIADTKDCTFFLSKTTHNAQRYCFQNCSWSDFKYGVSLQGDNNNSEFVFFDCHTSGIQSNGAFFYIGTADTSDQFVNYWFYGCTHWSTSAPFIDAAKGGQFQIYGLDASDFGSGLKAPAYLFRLRGAAHGLGVCQFTATGVRVEGKSKYAALIRSEWPQGQVTFRNVDYSSQSGSVSFGDIIQINYANTDGPIYSFSDSTLAGRVYVTISVTDWAHDHRIVFQNCDWLQRDSPTDVVHYGGSTVNAQAKPPVKFIGCRGGSGNPTTASGSNVWDATVGYRGQLTQTLEQRVVSLRAVNGVSAAEKLTVNLPVGALVTAFEVMAAAHGVTSQSKPTWTLATSELSGNTVAAVTADAPMATGFRVLKQLAQPFLCSSDATAKLSVAVSGADQDDAAALVLIHGFW